MFQNPALIMRVILLNSAIFQNSFEINAVYFKENMLTKGLIQWLFYIPPTPYYILAAKTLSLILTSIHASIRYRNILVIKKKKANT